MSYVFYGYFHTFPTCDDDLIAIPPSVGDMIFAHRLLLLSLTLELLLFHRMVRTKIVTSRGASTSASRALPEDPPSPSSSSGSDAGAQLDPHMPRDPDQRDIYLRLRGRVHRSPHYMAMDDLVFETLGRGSLAVVRRLLERVGWPELLHLSDRCYPELTSEILATYSFSSDVGAQFMVAGVPQTVATEDVYACFGWPTTDIALMPEDTSFQAIWPLITTPPRVFTVRESATSQICDPVYRILLRLISATLTARKESTNRINTVELWFLFCLHYGLRPDFVRMLNLKFSEVTSASTGDILIGGFCTRLAIAAGAFDPAMTDLEPLPPSRRIDRAYCIRMGIWSRRGDIYTLRPIFQGPWISCPDEGDAARLADMEARAGAGGGDTAQRQMEYTGHGDAGASTSQPRRRRRTEEQADDTDIPSGSLASIHARLEAMEQQQSQILQTQEAFQLQQATFQSSVESQFTSLRELLLSLQDTIRPPPPP